MIPSSQRATLPTTRVRFTQTVLLLCLAQQVIAQSVDTIQRDCFLEGEDVFSILDHESRIWEVNDTVLERTSIQSIVDCALKNDTIRLRTERLIRPVAAIKIERSIAIEGISSEATHITCPINQPLFIIAEVVDVVLRNFTIEGCRLSTESKLKSIIIVSGNCSVNNLRPTGSLEVTDISVKENINFGGGVVPHFVRPICFSLILKRIEFISNTINGSAFQASDNSFIDITVKGNLIQNESYHFLFNWPWKSSGIAIRLRAIGNEGSILRVKKGNFTLLNSDFRFNHLMQYGRLLEIQRSSLAINHTRFESNSCSEMAETVCVNILRSVSAGLHFLSFFKNSAQRAFAYINGRGNLRMTSSVFDSNESGKFSSDSLIIIDFGRKGSILLEDLIVRNNKAYAFFSTGGNNSPDRTTLEVRDSSFENNTGFSSSALTVSGIDSFRISNVNFTDNQSKDSGSVRLSSCTKVFIDSCSFIRNRATAGYGGGLWLSDTKTAQVANSVFDGRNSEYSGGGSSVTDLGKKSYVRFVNCVLANNKADGIGGGLFLYDYYWISRGVAIERTDFTSNYAQIAGGGIFTFHNDHLVIDCELGEPDIQNMTAADVTKSYVGHGRCQWFKGNKVGKRGSGNDIAGPAEEYYFFLAKRPTIARGLHNEPAEALQLEYYQLRKTKKGTADVWILAADSATETERNESNIMRLGDTLVIENWRPGDPLPMFAIFSVDRYGQSPAALHINGGVERMPVVNLQPTIENNRMILLKGDPPLSREPTSLQAIDYSAPPGEYLFSVKLEFLDNTTQVNVTFRECIINEEFPGGNFCKGCQESTYNFYPTDPSATCRECPEHLNCSSKFILPKNEYWNSFPCSVNAQRCINPDACRYHQDDAIIDLTDKWDCNFNKMEIELYWEDQCVEGHKGRLCSECKDGYGSAGAYTCGACRSPFLAIGFSTIAFGIVLVISSLQIGSVIELKTAAESLFRVQSLLVVDEEEKSTIEQSTSLEGAVSPSEIQPNTTDEDYNTERIKSKIRFAEILKNGINFVQTMTAAAICEQCRDLNAIAIPSGWIGGDPAEAASFSTECLLSTNQKTLVRQIVVAVIPLLVILILFSLFFKHCVCKRIDCSTLLKRCVLTLIVVLYVCYVSLARTTFSLLYCVNITVTKSLDDDVGPRNFWAMDTSKECFVGFHLVVALTVAFPILIFLFFFPIFVAASTLVVRSRKKLGSESALDTLGILYRGFNEETVYWDSLILLRKALIVAVLTFGCNLGGTLQGLACMGVLVISLYFHMLFRPFRAELGNLNIIESISLLVSILTFLGGVAIDDPEMQSTTADYILISVMVASNAGFILFLFHQLFKSKGDELKFSLLQSGINVKDKSLLSIFKAWTVMSVSFSVEMFTESVGRMIELRLSKRNGTSDEVDTVPTV